MDLGGGVPEWKVAILSHTFFLFDWCGINLESPPKLNKTSLKTFHNPY